MNEQPPAGWYPQGNDERYWDGSQWSDQRRPIQTAGTATQYAQPYTPPPVKQKHTVRNALLILLAVGVLFIGGCMAVVGLAANEVSKSIDESVAADKQPGGPDNPLKVSEGQAFEVSGFNYANGWSVGETFGLVDIKGLKVTNNRESKDSALVEIKFWNGSEVLALADCTTEPIAPATTTRLTCTSADKLPKSYDKITINDTF